VGTDASVLQGRFPGAKLADCGQIKQFVCQSSIIFQQALTGNLTLDDLAYNGSPYHEAAFRFLPMLRALAAASAADHDPK
jgi:hypothetical protein